MPGGKTPLQWGLDLTFSSQEEFNLWFAKLEFRQRAHDPEVAKSIRSLLDLLFETKHPTRPDEAAFTLEGIAVYIAMAATVAWNEDRVKRRSETVAVLDCPSGASLEGTFLESKTGSFMVQEYGDELPEMVVRDFWPNIFISNAAHEKTLSTSAAMAILQQYRDMTVLVAMGGAARAGLFATMPRDRRLAVLKKPMCAVLVTYHPAWQFRNHAPVIVEVLKLQVKRILHVSTAMQAGDLSLESDSFKAEFTDLVALNVAQEAQALGGRVKDGVEIAEAREEDQVFKPSEYERDEGTYRERAGRYRKDKIERLVRPCEIVEIVSLVEFRCDEVECRKKPEHERAVISVPNILIFLDRQGDEYYSSWNWVCPHTHKQHYLWDVLNGKPGVGRKIGMGCVPAKYGRGGAGPAKRPPRPPKTGLREKRQKAAAICHGVEPSAGGSSVGG